METTQKIPYSLAQKVIDRQNFINEFIPFVEDILEQNGRILKKHIGSYHTNTVAEIKNFGKFSFWGDLGQSSMGGNSIKIWYQDNLVLYVYYAVSVKECEVRIFENNTEWVHELKEAKKQKKQMLAQMEKQENESRKKEQQALLDKEEEERIKRDAERLKIEPS